MTTVASAEMMKGCAHTPRWAEWRPWPLAPTTEVRGDTQGSTIRERRRQGVGAVPASCSPAGRTTVDDRGGGGSRTPHAVGQHAS